MRVAGRSPLSFVQEMSGVGLDSEEEGGRAKH